MDASNTFLMCEPSVSPDHPQMLTSPSGLTSPPKLKHVHKWLRRKTGFCSWLPLWFVQIAPQSCPPVSWAKEALSWIPGDLQVKSCSMGLVSRMQSGGRQDKWGEDLNWKLAMHPGKTVGKWVIGLGIWSSWLVSEKIHSGWEMGTLPWRNCRKTFNLKAMLGIWHSPQDPVVRSLSKHGRPLIAWRDGSKIRVQPQPAWIKILALPLTLSLGKILSLPEL